MERSPLTPSPSPSPGQVLPFVPEGFGSRAQGQRRDDSQDTTQVLSRGVFFPNVWPPGLFLTPLTHKAILFHMREQRIVIFVLLLLATGLAACSPGHLGSNEIAFLRDGHLWTIDPDGANAFDVTPNTTPVVGYGWSPNHQILAFRSLDPGFARSSASNHLATNPITQSPGDLPSSLNTVGIDGGEPIPIMFSNTLVQHSNAWWSPTGTRLIYREKPAGPLEIPGAVSWWISQNDQPGGIARRFFPSSFSIPSLTSDSSLAIGNFQQGIFTTTIAATNLHYITQSILPGHPLPASLERVLWQPAHSHPAILYATTSVTSKTSTASSSLITPIPVQLMLRDANGQTTTITNCACTQFAWSPDGNYVLYSTGSSYTILNLNDISSFTISAENGSVPYWSPDSHFLLLDGLHTLLLVQVINGRQQVLLSDTTPSDTTSSSAMEPGIDALLSPISNNLWAADSHHFLFLTRGRLFWQGQRLSRGAGLYTVSINDSGQPQSTPTVVDTGNDTQAGWSYQDMNTSFLF